MPRLLYYLPHTLDRYIMHLFATREHNKMAAVGYVPAMKEKRKREKKIEKH